MAIASCKATLTNEIEAVQLDVGLIRQDLDKLRSHISVVEQRVEQEEEHTASIHTLQTKVWALEYKVDDAENKNKRNNLRIVGMPEGAKGRNPSVFLQELLRSLLPDAQFSPYFTVERAHQTPPAPGFSSSHPDILTAQLQGPG